MARPPETLEQVQALETEVRALQTQQRFGEALRKARQVVDARARLQGEHHRDLLAVLQTVTHLADLVGDVALSRETLERAVEVAETAFGPKTLETGRALDRLAYHHWMRGDWRVAVPMLDRALAIHEAALSPDDPQLAVYYDTQAAYYKMRAGYTRAERLHRKALAIREKLTGPLAMMVTTSHYLLGYLAWTRGQNDEAERYFQKVLAAYSKEAGSETGQATILETIARIYTAEGRDEAAGAYYDRAEKLHHATWEQRKEQFGEDHVVAAASRAIIASHYMQRERWPRALPHLEATRSLYRKMHGAMSMAAGAYNYQLATVYEKLGRVDETRKLLQEALAIEERHKKDAAVETAPLLLADFEHRQGRFAVAQKMMRRVLTARSARFGPNHPHSAWVKSRLARLAWARGRPAKAVPLLTRALEDYEPYLAIVLETGTEADRLKYLQSIAYQLDEAVSLHAQGLPNDGGALELALTTVLRRKGRVLDAMADDFSALHRRLGRADRERLEALAAARSRLGTLILKGPEGRSGEVYARAVAEAEAEVRRLEAALGETGAAFKAARTPVTVGAVQAAMPGDAALIELVGYRPVNPRVPWGDEEPRRYAAYVLPKSGDPSFVDLGPADRIDALVGRFREALADPDRDDVVALGGALDALVMRPIRPALSATTRLFVAPDGALNLVPFGALTDEHGRFLVERYAVTYLTSGRDLIRLRAAAEPRERAVVLADPTFDAAKQATGTVRGLRSADLLSRSWSPLPGTAQEAAALKDLLDGARFLTGSEATETALKSVQGPRVLHVATHGFFLAPAENTDPELKPPENPLLRSGLVLTGANGLASGEDDGVLTALEASGLDLSGTRLVVLSACETGVGAITAGEGVYGLRRALVIAGAETQVMSLWQVDDEATRDLMVTYYKRLSSGTGRSDALRQAQLRLLSGKRKHPFYWASFISSGQWAPMPEPGAGATQ